MKPAVVREAWQRAVHVEAGWEVEKNASHFSPSDLFRTQGHGMATFTIRVGLPSLSSLLEMPSQECPQVCFTSYADNKDWSPHFPTRQECKWSLCSVQCAGHSLWEGKSIPTEIMSWITIKLLKDFTVVSYFMMIKKKAVCILPDSNNNLWAS